MYDTVFKQSQFIYAYDKPTENFGRSVIVHRNFQGKYKSLKKKHLYRENTKTFRVILHYTIIGQFAHLKNCPEMENG